MIPTKIKLINSKGISRGSNGTLKEIELDFSDFEPGLVLFYGPSGSGKTTILDALHFYRFRDKTWDFHFFPDGYKEIAGIYKENEYLAQIYENTASLFKNGVLQNKTRKVSEYDECVIREFGDPKIFFKLLYAGKVSKNILDSTPGEKKQIVLDYLLDYLKDYEIKYLPKLQDDYSLLLQEIKFLQGKIDNKDKLLEDIKNIEDNIALKNLSLGCVIQALIDLGNYNLKYLEQELNNENIRKEIEIKEKELFTLNSSKDQIIYKINFNEKKIESEIRPLFNEIKKYLTKVTVDTTSIVILADAEEQIKKIETKNIELKNEIGQWKYKLNLISESIVDILTKIENIQQINLPCTSELQIKCPAIAFKNQNELVEGYKLDLESKQEEKHKISLSIIQLEEDINSNLRRLPSLENAVKNQKLIEEAKEKQKQFQGLKDKAKAFKDEISKFEEELIPINSNIQNCKDLIPVLNAKLCQEYVDKSSEIKDNEVEQRNTEYTINELNKNLITLKEEVKSIEENENKLIEKRKEAENYPLLIQFFGKEGGMVYELQRAGEDISIVANKLLEFYENKSIEIKFDTLKQNKKGEYLEEFNILYRINGSEWKSYSSGGESAIIANAIREALTFIKQTHDYKTVCLDEMDGSIDEPQRINYIKLLEEGHKLNNRHFTFLISHTSELLPYIRQKVIFDSKKQNIRLEK